MSTSYHSFEDDCLFPDEMEMAALLTCKIIAISVECAYSDRPAFLLGDYVDLVNEAKNTITPVSRKKRAVEDEY